MRHIAFTLALCAFLQKMTTVMGACEEDGNALFFYRYEEVEDESPVALHLPCLYLSEIKGYKEICENHIDSNDGRGPAREVCPVTCGTCPRKKFKPFSSSPTISPHNKRPLGTRAPKRKISKRKLDSRQIRRGL